MKNKIEFLAKNPPSFNEFLADNLSMNEDQIKEVNDVMSKIIMNPVLNQIKDGLIEIKKV